MIDNIKFQIKEKDKFENFVVSSKIIDLMTIINLFTSEINLYPKKGKYKNLHLLVGFSDNKDHSSFLEELIALKPKSLACTRFTQNIFRRTADPKKLKSAALKIKPGLKANSFLDPRAALAWSQAQLGPEDLLLVTGSMFLSGELRPIFKEIK